MIEYVYYILAITFLTRFFHLGGLAYGYTTSTSIIFYPFKSEETARDIKWLDYILIYLTNWYEKSDNVYYLKRNLFTNLFSNTYALSFLISFLGTLVLFNIDGLIWYYSLIIGLSTPTIVEMIFIACQIDS